MTQYMIIEYILIKIAVMTLRNFKPSRYCITNIKTDFLASLGGDNLECTYV